MQSNHSNILRRVHSTVNGHRYAHCNTTKPAKATMVASPKKKLRITTYITTNSVYSLAPKIMYYQKKTWCDRLMCMSCPSQLSMCSMYVSSGGVSFWPMKSSTSKSGLFLEGKPNLRTPVGQHWPTEYHIYIFRGGPLEHFGSAADVSGPSVLLQMHMFMSVCDMLTHSDPTNTNTANPQCLFHFSHICVAILFPHNLQKEVQVRRLDLDFVLLGAWSVCF